MFEIAGIYDETGKYSIKMDEICIRKKNMHKNI